MTLAGTAKWLLGILALLVVAALACGLWLRFEFERVSHRESAFEARLKVPVSRLDSDIPESEDCENTFPNNNAWFGALHVHTSASYDATAFGVTTNADDAFRFARGEALKLRLRGDPPGLDVPVLEISSPLDFMAITDHAESLGENRLCLTPGSDAYGTLVCRLFRGDIRIPADQQLQPLIRLASQAIFGKDRSRRVCGVDGADCRSEAVLGWQQNQRSTEAFHDRSGACRFTTLHGYEYTLAEQSSNLHRNVIFANDAVPQALASAKEARTPEALWQWLSQTCVKGDTSCNALAIPHNSNWSSGRMWYPPSQLEVDAETQSRLASLRAEMEPLAEIMQVKGDSECRNGISSVAGVIFAD